MGEKSQKNPRQWTDGTIVAEKNTREIVCKAKKKKRENTKSFVDKSNIDTRSINKQQQSAKTGD